MSGEEWRAVAGYEGLYEVSSVGRVRSLDRVVVHRNGGVRSYRGMTLSQSQNDSLGHLALRLSQKGKTRLWLVHRLVAMAFIPNPENAPIVRHLDDVPSHNSVGNLAWGTQFDNMADMLRNGGHWETKRTHCKNGHEFTPENTLRRSDGGGRKCRECHRVSSLAWVHRKNSRIEGVAA